METKPLTNPVETEGVADSVDTEGKNDAQETEALTMQSINELTGRQFKDVDDFKKHYKELNSFVGKAGQEKKEVAEIPKEGPQSDKLSELERRIKQFEDAKEKENFLLRNSEANQYMDLIEAVAQKENLSLEEAWEKKVKRISTDDVVLKSVNRAKPGLEQQELARIQNEAAAGNYDAQLKLVKQINKNLG